MNTKKATKRALLTSVMALVMCVVMLVGTTFAWFTDTASTGVNKIQAGNLDVALEMKNANGGWDDAENQTLSFTNKQGSADILWEPGAKFQLPTLRVANNGNLALKYKVVFSAVNGGNDPMKLAKVLDVYMGNTDEPVCTLYDALISTDADGFAHGNLTAKGTAGATSGEITIAVKMRESAGNEYKNLFIGGVAVTVYATQDTVEYDSKDNLYDKDAKFPIGTGTQSDPYQIHDAVTLSQIKNSGEYTYYKIADGVTEIDCTNVSWLDLYGEFDGNGATLTNLKKSLFHNVGNGKNSDETTVLKNFTAVMNTPNALVFNISGKNTEFNNVKVSGYMEGTWNMAAFVNYGTKNNDSTGYDYTVNFVNCACDATIVSKGNNSAAILVGHTYSGAGTATIKLDSATDKGIESATLRAKPVNSGGRVSGFKYYGVGTAVVYVGDETATANSHEITALTIANPTKSTTDSTYSVSKADGAVTVKTNVNAQLTAYNNGTPDTNKAGITFSLGTVADANFEHLLGRVTSVEIVNDVQIDDICKYAFENGKLTVYTNRTDNYATGKVFITVSQYDEAGTLVSVGELTIAEKADVNGSWTVK